MTEEEEEEEKEQNEWQEGQLEECIFQDHDVVLYSTLLLETLLQVARTGFLARAQRVFLKNQIYNRVLNGISRKNGYFLEVVQTLQIAYRPLPAFDDHEWCRLSPVTRGWHRHN